MGYFSKELNDIGFEVYEPNEILKPYIYNYWSISSEEAVVSSSKILSDGSMGFLLNFSKAFDLEVNNERFLAKQVSLSGPTKHPSFMHFNGILDALGIRFKAGKAYAFFHEPLHTLLDKNIDYYHNKTWEFTSLYKQTQTCKNNHERVQYLENFLIQHLKKTQKVSHPYFADILEYIRNEQGNVAIENLASKYDITVRSLARLFKKELGISAKLYARIIRMRHARDVLSSLRVHSLTQVGYDVGFFDQAHFIKEFKHFMIQTPKSYLEYKQRMAEVVNYKKF